MLKDAAATGKSTGTNTEFKAILLGVKQPIDLSSPKEKRSLALATVIMLITGILTDGPAVILGKLVDQWVGGTVIQFGGGGALHPSAQRGRGGARRLDRDSKILH
jgi:hypothetical protein